MGVCTYTAICYNFQKSSKYNLNAHALHDKIREYRVCIQCVQYHNLSIKNLLKSILDYTQPILSYERITLFMGILYKCPLSRLKLLRSCGGES